jgi:hypothetical protein
MKVLGICPTTNKFIETHTGHQFVIYYFIEFERINKWLDRRIKMILSIGMKILIGLISVSYLAYCGYERAVAE